MTLDRSRALTSGRDVIYLAACALHGRCPRREAIERMDLEAVFCQASRHSMQAITYMAVARYMAEYGREGLWEPLLEQWKKSHDAALHFLVMADIEKESLLNVLEQRGIWYMPLKGTVIQELYPRLGMRQMSDVDILIDPTRRAEVRDLMAQQGYRKVCYGTEHPDTYQKGTVCFEMHHGLFPRVEQNRVFCHYYRHVKDILLADHGQFGFRFGPEDRYVYHTAHAYKHFSDMGDGIRSLMDVYILCEKAGESFDRSYVADQLARLGMTAFEGLSRELAQILFSPVCHDWGAEDGLLTEEQREMLDFHISSGTFGTEQQRIGRLIGAAGADGAGVGAKLRYVLRRLFPGRDYYKMKYPVAHRFPVLIPVFWLWRLITMGFNKPKQRLYELKILRQSKK